MKIESWHRTQLFLQTCGDNKKSWSFRASVSHCKMGVMQGNRSLLQELGNETLCMQGSPSKAGEFHLLMVWDWL